MANIGMMEGAYFVGRVELLNWLNDLLKLDYTKVEQTCSGAAHCQIMDAIYPGKVPLSKVNFAAKHEYEFINNFKVLQTTFDKLGLDKFIDVQKMVKGKYQDNLEFLQWIKRYFDLNYSGGEYNAVERRSQASTKSTGSAPKKTSIATTTAPKKATTTEAPKKAVAPPSATKSAVSSVAKTTTVGSATKPKVAKSTPSATHSDSNEKVEELTQNLAELKVTIDGLEKERDFYFSKLREIEILCQSNGEDSAEVLPKIFKILYATDDSEGFSQVQEEEGVEEGVAEEQTEEEIESF